MNDNDSQRIVAEEYAATDPCNVCAGRGCPDCLCDCYPGGVTPATYEGPQEWCPVHGRVMTYRHTADTGHDGNALITNHTGAGPGSTVAARQAEEAS